MNSVALIATDWYFLMVKLACAAAVLRWCTLLRFGSDVSKETAAQDRLIRTEVLKNLWEFALALTLWLVSTRRWASTFDDVLLSVAGPWEIAIFLLSSSLTVVLLPYASVWVWGFTLKSSEDLARDSLHDEHVLYSFAKRVGMVRIAAIVAKVTGITLLLKVVTWLARACGGLVYLVVNGYWQYYRKKLLQT